MALIRTVLRLLGVAVLLSLFLGIAGSPALHSAFSALAGLVLLVLLLALLGAACYVALFAWVGRDAKARGLHETASWLTWVHSRGPLGLLTYLFARPSGRKVLCPNCHHRRLDSMVVCPICGT